MSKPSDHVNQPEDPTISSDFPATVHHVVSGDKLKPVPELPRALTDIWPVIAVGSGLWLVAFAVLLVRYLVSTGPADIWLWTTLSGVVISAVGIGILSWQRAAARRGSRSAQRVL